MSKTILITGATSGIGLETVKLFIKNGHKVILHGRSATKLKAVHNKLAQYGEVASYLADFSSLQEAKNFADTISKKYDHLDVLINNAGVLNAPQIITAEGFDIRFVTNTFVPYLITQKLLPLLEGARVINLSSAAQKSVDLDTLETKRAVIDALDAYSQSKLALTMWSKALATSLNRSLGNKAPAIIAVNPGSLLASKMVKDGFGIVGNDLSVGANILVKASLSDEFAAASGKYFDNDIAQFKIAHPEMLDNEKITALMSTLDKLMQKYI